MAEKIPYVVMPHGMLDPYSVSVHAWRKKIYMNFWEQTNLDNASRIVFTTHQEESSSRIQFPWLGPGEVICLGADGSRSDRAALSGAFRSKFPIIRDRLCILFLGRIHPKKGIERIIIDAPEIIHSVPNVLFIIAGGGDTSYVDYVHRKVKASGLESFFLFTGFISGETKWEALASASIFVLPSRQENFGIAVAEAMRAGTPVVVSKNVNTWPLVLESGGGQVFDFDSREGFVTAVECVLALESQANSLGAKGRAFALRSFDWGNTAKSVSSLYSNVLSSHGS